MSYTSSTSNTISMTPSRVLEKIRAGRPAFSTKINSLDPRIVEIAAMAGFDCIWLDREHCGNDLRVIEDQIRAARMHGADSIVRVARGSYSEYIWPLEMNATAIMVPHLMSAAEATPEPAASHPRLRGAAYLVAETAGPAYRRLALPEGAESAVGAAGAIARAPVSVRRRRRVERRSDNGDSTSQAGPEICS